MFPEEVLAQHQTQTNPHSQLQYQASAPLQVQNFTTFSPKFPFYSSQPLDFHNPQMLLYSTSSSSALSLAFLYCSPSSSSSHHVQLYSTYFLHYPTETTIYTSTTWKRKHIVHSRHSRKNPSSNSLADRSSHNRNRAPHPNNNSIRGIYSSFSESSSFGGFLYGILDFIMAPFQTIKYTKPNTKKRILILMSDTGGGHRASANALQKALDSLYPNQLEMKIVDFFVEIMGAPFNKFPEFYSYAAKHPALWRFIYGYGVFYPTRLLTEKVSNILAFNKVIRAFQDYRPDLILSVHPLCQFISIKALKRLGIFGKVPYVTVVTDLADAHPTWFHKDCDMTFVPSQRVKRFALKYGIAPDRVRLWGLPVREDFWKEPRRSKKAIQKSLGLQPNALSVLVVGGGDGVGGIAKIAIALAHTLHKHLGPEAAQIFVVCGKNHKIKAQLDAYPWPINVVVEGFVSNMSDIMAASDAIVTKAGPGTIEESLIRGLPIVVSGFLPGQEAGNVGYVTQAGVGVFQRDPDLIAQTVAEWFTNPAQLAQMSTKAKSMGHPKATHAIAKDIGDILFASIEKRKALSSRVILAHAYTHTHTHNHHFTPAILPMQLSTA